MGKRFWVVSPNAKAEGDIKYWLDKSIREKKVFMGWGTDNKLGNTFENKVSINDCIVIAQGAKDDRKLYLAGIVTSKRFEEYVDGEIIYYRHINYYLSGDDFINNQIVINSNNAFGESSNPGAIYELKENAHADKIVMEKISNQINEKIKMKSQEEKIELLKYKKQIILQGPPGTGKTRLAKIMAEELILEKLSIEKIDKKFIQENVKKGLKLSTPDKIGKEEDLFVDSIVGETINLKISTGTNYSVTFDQVLKCITEPNDPSPRSYAKGIIHFLKCELAKTQRKLIQFHPAYSYEDFVRGITVEVSNGLPEYITKNKILGDFAQKANNNFLESQKAPEQLSEERWLNEEIKKFAEIVEDEIVDKGSYILNDSVSLFAVDDDCFRYTGKNWDLKNKYRMKFTDIIQAQINNVQDKQDFKKLRKIGIISGRSWQHSSYDLIVLNKFRDYLGERKAPIQVESVKLENYVLIIDEINRANLPAVLGELIYALEYRNHPVESMYDLDGDNTLTLPPNLYIIGTMNTADRSVGHIDYAIRRRFSFVDVLPSLAPIRNVGKEYFKTVSSLFIKNFDEIDWTTPKLIASEHLASDFKPEDVWLGHSYFITKEKDENGNTIDENHQIRMKLKYEIVPILKEYVKDGILQETEAVKTIINDLIS